MKSQDLFSLKNKKQFLECRLLQILFGALSVNYVSELDNKTYCIYPKYWDTHTLYHTFPKIRTNPFYYLFIGLKCWMSGRQRRP